MKKWLIKKIRLFYARVSRNLYEEVHADRVLSFLSPLFVGWTYLPITDWAAGPEYYAHICNDIVINRKKMVVETGSGISTILLARLIKKNNLNTKIVSIDHDAVWQNIVAQNLEADGIDDIVEFKHCPLVQREGVSWYDTESIVFPENFVVDTVVVDGPIGNVPMARLGAVPFLKQYLSPECYTIYLHDTDREEEQRIVSIWTESLPSAEIKWYPRYAIFQFGTAFCFSPQSQT